jgi:hypothetical protein
VTLQATCFLSTFTDCRIGTFGVHFWNKIMISNWQNEFDALYFDACLQQALTRTETLMFIFETK